MCAGIYGQSLLFSAHVSSPLIALIEAGADCRLQLSSQCDGWGNIPPHIYRQYIEPLYMIGHNNFLWVWHHRRISSGLISLKCFAELDATAMRANNLGHINRFRFRFSELVQCDSFAISQNKYHHLLWFSFCFLFSFSLYFIFIMRRVIYN